MTMKSDDEMRTKSLETLTMVDDNVDLQKSSVAIKKKKGPKFKNQNDGSYVDYNIDYWYKV